METPNVGQIPTNGIGRDAIHIAIIEVLSGETLKVGQRVKVIRQNGTWYAYPCLEGIVPDGIVDPFLALETIPPETKFWLFLMPGTITSLRHVWTHPTFKVSPTEVRS